MQSTELSLQGKRRRALPCLCVLPIGFIAAVRICPDFMRAMTWRAGIDLLLVCNVHFGLYVDANRLHEMYLEGLNGFGVSCAATNG